MILFEDENYGTVCVQTDLYRVRITPKNRRVVIYKSPKGGYDIVLVRDDYETSVDLAIAIKKGSLLQYVVPIGSVKTFALEDNVLDELIDKAFEC